MKIVADEPGRRLAIEDIGGRLPFSLVALAAGVVILGAVAAGRWSLADVQDLISRRVIPAPNGELDLALFSAGLLYLISLRGGTRVDALEVDAAQGLFSWRKSYLAGFFRWSGRLETPSVDTFTFSRTPRGGGKEELRLALRAGQRTPITFDFNVEKIDTTEKVADFALRLASLAGLSYYLVLRSDAALFEMRALRHPEPGALAVPSVAGQAQYEKGVAIPAAVRAAGRGFNDSIPNRSRETCGPRPGIRAVRSVLKKGGARRFCFRPCSSACCCRSSCRAPKASVTSRWDGSWAWLSSPWWAWSRR